MECCQDYKGLALFKDCRWFRLVLHLQLILCRCMILQYIS